MTWGEFKAWMDKHDTVTDETPIWFIDITNPILDLKVKHDAFGGGVGVWTR